MRPSFRKNALAAAIAGAALLGSQAAMGAMITEWSYQVDSGFTAWSPDDADSPNVGVTGLNENPNLPGAFTRLEWGDPVEEDSPSAFTVTPTVTDPPSLFTNEDFVDGAELTHENFPLWSATSDSLTDATLLTSLLLSPAAPPSDDEVGPFPVNLEIAFEETPNLSDGDECADGGTVGEDEPHLEGCGDIFVLSNPGILEAPANFTLDGFEYTVFLGAEGLEILDDSSCAAVGQGPGCLGFVTPENEATTLQAQFRIEARPIAEPLTLGLLGLGLVGIGALTARRREGEDA